MATQGIAVWGAIIGPVPRVCWETVCGLVVAFLSGGVALGCESDAKGDGGLGRLSTGDGVSCRDGDAARCEQNLGEDAWWCQCSGSEGSVDATTCESALAKRCSVNAASECVVATLGACQRSDEGSGYDCVCTDEVLPRDDEQCVLALSRACAVPCKLPGFASCEPTGAELEYECVCSYYGGAHVRETASQCRFAAAACEPGEQSGDGWCKDLVGRCDAVAEGYDCFCINGTAESGVDSSTCAAALELVCGGIEIPTDVVCEGQVTRGGETWNVTCRKDLSAQEPTYACECSGSEVTTLGMVADESCAAALERACVP